MMDPHKVPPQGLKDIFKELRSIKDKDDSRIAAHSVLDFGIDPAKESAEKVCFLEKIFDYFHSQTAINPSLLGNPLSRANFFTANDIPGRYTHPISAIDEVPQWNISGPISIFHSSLEFHLI